MNQSKRTAIKLLLNDPLNWSTHLRAQYNPGYMKRLINSLIPGDTGIEFEVGKKLTKVIRKRYSRKIGYEEWEPFEWKIRLTKQNLRGDLRILKGIYEIIDDPDCQSKRFEKSGIHIHTNLPFHWCDKEMSWVNCHINELNLLVMRLAKEFFRYGGQYNSLDFNSHKGHAVIYRSEFNTIEYRCINMTFDFRTLLAYIIMCHEVTRIINARIHEKIGYRDSLREFDDMSRVLLHYV